MQYSLLDRFRGTFLGGALGEDLGQLWSKQLRTAEPALSLNQIGQRLRMSNLLNREYLYFGSQGLVRFYASNLVERGEARLDFGDSQRHPPSASWMANEAALLAMPLALFFHEDLSQLQQQWQRALELWHPSLLSLSDGVRVVAYAISQALKAQLQPRTLMPQAIAHLQATQPATPHSIALVQQLSLVQTLLEERAALATVLTHLRQGEQLYTPLAIAFYCFLSSPDDLHLAVVRAARSDQWPSITCALTGILAGAYGGLASIPGNWLNRILAVPPGKMAAVAFPSMETDLLSLSEQLWSAWSGNYDPTSGASDVACRTAIAAPRILRLR